MEERGTQHCNIKVGRCIRREKNDAFSPFPSSSLLSMHIYEKLKKKEGSKNKREPSFPEIEEERTIQERDT